MTKHLETIWHADTLQGHEIRVLHRDIPVDGPDSAFDRSAQVNGLVLHDDGRLTCLMQDGTASNIDPADVRIETYVRPQDARGERFIPDMMTQEGRDRILSTFTDPRHVATDEDYAPAGFGLAELAAIPGAAGSLSSVAYDLR